MKSDFAGEFLQFQSVGAGEIFSFRMPRGLALAMKLSRADVDDPADILILARSDKPGIEPHVVAVTPRPQSVLVHPSALLALEALPADVPNDVLNACPGTVLVTRSKRFICAKNDENNDFDPVLIDVENGALAGISTKEATAVFRQWRIVVKRGTAEDVLLSYTAKAVGG
jgi:hypothetical protein